MNNFTLSGLYKIVILVGFGFVLHSCNEFKSSDYTTYFGGEIINPKSEWVLLYKDNQLIDSIPLDEKNRFFVKYDSLAQGLYAFHHEPEFQYVYFDKNDSLMLRLNTHDFDESLVFCGRGEEKNNFLIEMYLLNKKDKAQMNQTFDLSVEEFLQVADSSYQQALAFYEKEKNKLEWSADFELYAKAAADFHYYSKRESYPIAHPKRNPQDSLFSVSDEYYDFRNDIALNNEKLAHFVPYVRYLTSRIDNLTYTKNSELTKDAEALKKLTFLDSLIENPFLKSRIANHIVFFYLVNENNLSDDNKILEKYHQITTDSISKARIERLAESIKNMASGNKLPEISLTDNQNRTVSSNELFNSKTVVFFWSKKSEQHCFSIHKKVNALAQQYTNIKFVAINLDEDFPERREFLSKNGLQTPQVKQYQIADSKELYSKWTTPRFSQTLIVDQDGIIINAFANIFETDFEKNL
ncbi:MAG: redoxin domain-containing protein [Flavobacteriaceae bacterium]